ncbi:hypothetical protein CS022_10805 [Veronia nyctiphanis]|uniref:Carboxyltransferase domain-containing protein n=1 Tax=Veronia nyctiphanis TaxID=1278244 RepID=A0A4Q0YQD0_9GAMM|nr:carboxyltransferase domain-containing protein [Veronia nyctiphanis]RXJ73226.1 hypothetical protein CS022_10805 [Veronia nyctiphanis]
MSTIKIEPVNESALIIYFGITHSAEVSDEVRNATLSITHYLAPHLLDIVPAYHSILVTFDAGMVSGKHLTEQLQILLQDQPPETTKTHNKHISIPVYYGNDVAGTLIQLGLSAVCLLLRLFNYIRVVHTAYSRSVFLRALAI